jgi:predicted dinucleotide-binding enzyme
MRIAVIGMGKVGSTLGRRWAAAGHEVVFGVRDPNAPDERTEAEQIGSTLATARDAATGSEVVLLAVPWRAVTGVLREAGDLSGKILLDCTNPLTPDFAALEIGHTTSAGEEVARQAPGARVVKIFNTNGVANMADPDYGGSRVTMLYAGDDAGANKVAAGLAAEIGFEPVELGPLSAARLLEPLALTWIVLSRQRGLGKAFALNLVTPREGAWKG